MSTTYSVRFYSHTGLSGIPKVGLSLSEARLFVARVIRRRRRTGHRVATLAPRGGEAGRWEACEPEGSALVPDTAGILVMERHDTDEEETDGDEQGV